MFVQALFTAWHLQLYRCLVSEVGLNWSFQYWGATVGAVACPTNTPWDILKASLATKLPSHPSPAGMPLTTWPSPFLSSWKDVSCCQDDYCCMGFCRLTFLFFQMFLRPDHSVASLFPREGLTQCFATCQFGVEAMKSWRAGLDQYTLNILIQEKKD